MKVEFTLNDDNKHYMLQRLLNVTPMYTAIVGITEYLDNYVFNNKDDIHPYQIRDDIYNILHNNGINLEELDGKD